jgi:polyphosphate kinase
MFFNRELSWLEFNDRVLRQGLADDVPLLERIKFLAIVSSNLDEFFLVRVAGLMQARKEGSGRADVSGMTPTAQLAAIARRVHELIDEQLAGVRAALAELAAKGLKVLCPAEWSDAQRQYLATTFAKEILPALTPLAVEDLRPAPHLPGLQWFVAAVIAVPDAESRQKAVGSRQRAEGRRRKEEGSGQNAEGEGSSLPTAYCLPPTAESSERIVVTAVPNQFSRWVILPGEPATEVRLARLEDVVAANMHELFSGAKVLASALFRITRDADVMVESDESDDMLEAVERAVLTRQRRPPVRLQVSPGADARLRRWLETLVPLQREEIYETDSSLDAAALFELSAWPGFDHLRNPEWPPQTPRDLMGSEDLFDTLLDHDVLLFHPYETFEPVVQFVERAAADPQVLAIKQTLYRTSGNSPIVRALGRAAQNGKEVTVLVELRARFDEARNIQWARRLEEQGCHVIYGIAGYKTHAKALLVVRRQGNRIQRFAHLATGNYNDRTARLYSDFGLMTADRDICGDVAAFFNLLTGLSEPVGWSKLAIAPTGLRRRFIDLIEREVQVSTPDRPGLIMAKFNSLEEPTMCEALYRASQAGVKVMLNIRGLCVLRPGVPGISDNIEVRSIIDRFLEHARIFYFRNGGHDEVYLASADWMRRNLLKRLEIMFPVLNPQLRKRLIEVLNVYFADNVKARRLLPTGKYEPYRNDGPPMQAQAKFYKDALDLVRVAEQSQRQFHPLTGPQ